LQAGLKAALRLQPREFRAWLLRRVRTAPLAAPIDPACFAISDRDLALLLKQLPMMADDADSGTAIKSREKVEMVERMPLTFHGARSPR
jgi:hypothetical protein